MSDEGGFSKAKENQIVERQERDVWCENRHNGFETLLLSASRNFSFLTRTVEVLAQQGSRSRTPTFASGAAENAATAATLCCQEELEADGELSKCMFHVKKCTKDGVELRMIMPELNRSMYFYTYVLYNVRKRIIRVIRMLFFTFIEFYAKFLLLF